MTVDVRGMPAGREMDAMVAEAMGCKVRRDFRRLDTETCLPGGGTGFDWREAYCECGDGRHGRIAAVPFEDRRISSDPWELDAYSTDIGAAWTAATWFGLFDESHPQTRTLQSRDGKWVIYESGEAIVWAETAPLAICRAILALVPPASPA